MKILNADISDAEEILELQKLAYMSEALIYNDYNISPLTQTFEEIKAQFRDRIFLKAASEENIIIGTVRAYEKMGTAYIGMLAVHPDYRNRGIGSAIMNAAEGRSPSCRLELFTGIKSRKNIYLYKKLGYILFKTKKYGNGDIEIVYMEKNKI
jgi:ribosomal protein S18 acetylase RimI-like enzyme